MFKCLPVLSVEMPPKISDDKGERSKKNLRPRRGSLSIFVSTGIRGPYICVSTNVTILAALIHLQP